jgi:Na+/H+ antiporter NhaC
MSIHVAGILGLVVIFALGTLRPVNLGVLALAMTFIVGSVAARETPAEMYRGFPVDLFILLTGVTYLFAVAERNGTVVRIVEGAVRLARGRRPLIPWVVFAVAAAPAMAGAIGSAGVALVAPVAMRLAERCGIDRRLIGLMVVHGVAAGNFSPLNVLGAIVLQAVNSRGLQLSAWDLSVPLKEWFMWTRMSQPRASSVSAPTIRRSGRPTAAGGRRANCRKSRWSPRCTNC